MQVCADVVRVDVYGTIGNCVEFERIIHHIDRKHRLPVSQNEPIFADVVERLTCVTRHSRVVEQVLGDCTQEVAEHGELEFGAASVEKRVERDAMARDHAWIVQPRRLAIQAKLLARPLIRERSIGRDVRAARIAGDVPFNRGEEDDRGLCGHGRPPCGWIAEFDCRCSDLKSQEQYQFPRIAFFVGRTRKIWHCIKNHVSCTTQRVARSVMSIAVIGSLSKLKIEAAASVIALRVEGCKVESGVNAQPVGLDEIMRGANNRARAARIARPEREVLAWIGVESGLVHTEFEGNRVTFDIAAAVVYMRNDTDSASRHFATSVGIPMNQIAVRQTEADGLDSHTVGEYYAAISDAQRDDPHSFITHRKYSRFRCLAEAIKAACAACWFSNA